MSRGSAADGRQYRQFPPSTERQRQHQDQTLRSQHHVGAVAGQAEQGLVTGLGQPCHQRLDGLGEDGMDDGRHEQRHQATAIGRQAAGQQHAPALRHDPSAPAGARRDADHRRDAGIGAVATHLQRPRRCAAGHLKPPEHVDPPAVPQRHRCTARRRARPRAGGRGRAGRRPWPW